MPSAVFYGTAEAHAPNDLVEWWDASRWHLGPFKECQLCKPLELHCEQPQFACAMTGVKDGPDAT